MNGQVLESSFAFEEDLKLQRFILNAAKKELYFKLCENDSRMKNWLVKSEPLKWNLRDFQNFSKTDDLIEKHLAFDFTHGPPGHSQRLRSLDEQMRNYLRAEFKLDVMDLKKKWREQCWNCSNSSDQSG